MGSPGLEKLDFLVPQSKFRKTLCASKFVHLVNFRGTRVHLIVYLVVHQMKYLMER